MDKETRSFLALVGAIVVVVLLWTHFGGHGGSTYDSCPLGPQVAPEEC
jgi:hypothetical protein